MLTHNSTESDQEMLESPSGRYVYTGVPPNMTGTELYSLTGLQKVFPAIAAKAMEKYQSVERADGSKTPDRLALIERDVPLLGGKWLDAIFLSETDPSTFSTSMCREVRKIYHSMAADPEEKARVDQKVNRMIATLEANRYYRIPVEALAGRTVVRASFPSSYKPEYTLATQDSFVPGGFAVSQEQVNAWREEIGSNGTFISYSRTPHLLVAARPEGNNLNGLDVSKFKIVSPVIDKKQVFDDVSERRVNILENQNRSGRSV